MNYPEKYKNKEEKSSQSYYRGCYGMVYIFSIKQKDDNKLKSTEY